MPGVHAHSRKLTLTLEETVGVPSGHPSAPTSVSVAVEASNPSDSAPSSSDASSSTTTGHHFAEDTTQWPFAEALSTRRPVFIADVADLADGFEARGWNVPATAAVCV